MVSSKGESIKNKKQERKIQNVNKRYGRWGNTKQAKKSVRDGAK